MRDVCASAGTIADIGMEAWGGGGYRGGVRGPWGFAMGCRKYVAGNECCGGGARLPEGMRTIGACMPPCMLPCTGMWEGA